MSADAEIALRHQRVKEIFAAVADVPTSTRDALLSSLCGEDAVLRAEVCSLLEHEDGSALDLTAAGGHVRGAVVAALDELAGGAGQAGQSVMAQQQIAEFRTLSVLGEGGMGVVYLAEQESPRRLVALKLVRPGFAGREVLRRFRREAEVLGALRHPNIAQIYSAGTTTIEGHGSPASVPYFAMEYVAGLPITEHCRRSGLSIADRVRLFLSVCDAVEHAHGRGIIHRDLKPANILVEVGDGTTIRPGSASMAPTVRAEPGQSFFSQSSIAGTGALAATASATNGATGLGTPKVLDFGIARRDVVSNDGAASATVRTAADQIIGTLPYMSPEQFSGDSTRVDRRSDVYALGVILYQLLAGRLPLDLADCTLVEAARRVSESDPVSLGELVAACRGDLDTIVAKALEKEPERRYQSAAALAADLRRHLEDLPIEARPASGLYHLRKFARRNRGLVVGAAVATCTLIAATIVSIILAREAIASRDEAQRQLREVNLQIGRATQSYRVLETIVEAIAPRAATEPEPTLRGVLAKAREELVSMEAEEPEVVGMFLSQLARAHVRLGEAQAADELYAASLRHLRSSGPESARVPIYLPQTLAAAADVAAQLGRSAEARALRDEACRRYEDLRSTPGLGDDWVARLHLYIGNLRWANGELDLAVKDLHEGIAIQRRMQPDGDIPLAANELLLGTILSGLGRPLEAEAVFRAAHGTFQRLAAAEDPNLLKARTSLLMAVNQNGRFEEGRPLGSELLAACERIGVGGASLAGARLNVAFGLLGCGDPNAAIALCREVVAWRAEHLGPNSPDTARAKLVLASALRVLGELDEAVALAEDALRDHRAALGESNVRVAEDWLELAQIHLAAGRWPDAIAAAESAQATLVGFAGEDHALFGRALREEAKARAAAGDLQDARVLAQLGLKRVRQSTAPGHPQVAETMVALGAIHLLLGEPREAADLAEEARAELLKNAVADVLIAPCEALRGAALVALGRGDEGEELTMRAVRELTSQYGPAAPATLEARRWLEVASEQAAGRSAGP